MSNRYRSDLCLLHVLSSLHNTHTYSPARPPQSHMPVPVPAPCWHTDRPCPTPHQHPRSQALPADFPTQGTAGFHLPWALEIARPCHSSWHCHQHPTQTLPYSLGDREPRIPSAGSGWPCCQRGRIIKPMETGAADMWARGSRAYRGRCLRPEGSWQETGSREGGRRGGTGWDSPGSQACRERSRV